MKWFYVYRGLCVAWLRRFEYLGQRSAPEVGKVACTAALTQSLLVQCDRTLRPPHWLAAFLLSELFPMAKGIESVAHNDGVCSTAGTVHAGAPTAVSRPPAAEHPAVATAAATVAFSERNAMPPSDRLIQQHGDETSAIEPSMPAALRQDAGSTNTMNVAATSGPQEAVHAALPICSRREPRGPQERAAQPRPDERGTLQLDSSRSVALGVGVFGGTTTAHVAAVAPKPPGAMQVSSEASTRRGRTRMVALEADEESFEHGGEQDEEGGVEEEKEERDGSDTQQEQTDDTLTEDYPASASATESTSAATPTDTELVDTAYKEGVHAAEAPRRQESPMAEEEPRQPHVQDRMINPTGQATAMAEPGVSAPDSDTSDVRPEETARLRKLSESERLVDGQANTTSQRDVEPSLATGHRDSKPSGPTAMSMLAERHGVSESASPTMTSATLHQGALDCGTSDEAPEATVVLPAPRELLDQEGGEGEAKQEEKRGVEEEGMEVEGRRGEEKDAGGQEDAKTKQPKKKNGKLSRRRTNSTSNWVALRRSPVPRDSSLQLYEKDEDGSSTSGSESSETKDGTAKNKKEDKTATDTVQWQRSMEGRSRMKQIAKATVHENRSMSMRTSKYLKLFTPAVSVSTAHRLYPVQ